jgi:predicted membrane-bound dolichyl-phosphate-mannose-protein mannosyltransferase
MALQVTAITSPLHSSHIYQSVNMQQYGQLYVQYFTFEHITFRSNTSTYFSCIVLLVNMPTKSSPGGVFPSLELGVETTKYTL